MSVPIEFTRGMHSMLLFAALALSSAGQTAPAVYILDPEHTFPSFEADHMGISLWRGKFTRTAGEVTLDRAASQGGVNVTVDLSSVEFGHDKLNRHVTGPDFLDAGKYPTAIYKGALAAFVNGTPTRVEGELTFHGITKPLVLKINSFKCIPHPVLQREVCGADALGTLNRGDFGVDAGKAFGFRMDVTLRIQVEAIKSE